MPQAMRGGPGRARVHGSAPIPASKLGVFAALMSAVAGTAAVGCDAGDRAPAGIVVERTDSAGVEIVDNRMAIPDTVESARLPDSPALSIGRTEGAPEYLFARVAGAIRLADGRIVVGDGGSNRLRFYDETGIFLSAVGGDGQGPGEFEYLRTVRRCHPDAIHAFDLSWQLSVFDLSGEFQRRWVTQLPGGGAGETPRSPYSLSCDEEGRLLMAAWGAESFEERPQGYYRTQNVPIQLVSPEGDLIHDFGTWPGDERIGTAGGSGPHPFGKRLVHAVGGDRVYIGTGDAYEILVYTLDGRHVRTIRRSDVDLTIGEADVTRYIEERLEGMVGEQRAAAERELRGMPLADPGTFPAYVEFRVDSDAGLWLRRFTRPGETVDRWDVFSSDGAALGTLAFPPGFEVTEIGTDYVLGVAADELGVERVRMYERREWEGG